VAQPRRRRRSDARRDRDPRGDGYTSIAQTPIVTGVYTIIFPILAFALLGSSRLLVVGADSATAAILASGLAGLGVAGLTPGSQTWLEWTGLVALICGVFLVLARLLRLGFIGNFLSASVLIGFLSGVGIQVLSGQIPAMLGVAKGTGNWFQQQWHTITSIPDADAATVGYALGTVALIVGFKKFLPAVPGAVVAVVLSIVVSTVADSKAHGVSVIGSMDGGFPPLGLSGDFGWTDVVKAASIAFACFVLIVAQSAATSRSFAAKHGERVDINRDLVGLSGANLAAAFSGTFVVNGSPTKTQILDGQKGRTQVANMTMAAVALLFVMFLTSLLTNMPSAVLAGIVFMIGVDLVDLDGLRRIRSRRRAEFLIACATGVVVFAVGVEQGIILAILLSLLDVVRRAYEPGDFVIGEGTSPDDLDYKQARAGAESRPGLVVFRFDAPLFYANANRFSDDVKAVVDGAPTPVRWLVLDCSAIDDIDYSAGLELTDLVSFVHQRGAQFGLARADDALLATLRTYGVLDRVAPDRVFDHLDEVFAAWEEQPPAETAAPGPTA